MSVRVRLSRHRLDEASLQVSRRGRVFFLNPGVWSEADPVAAIDLDRGLTRVERRRARTAGDGGPWFFTRRASASRSVWSVSNLETDLVRRPRVRGTAPQATVGMERQLFHPYLSRSERRWLSRAVVRSRCETPKMDGSFPDVPPFTWLILPVVICLSQRLSHASVSTCRQMAKPRTAH